MTNSAHPDPELRDWLRWASESARTPNFVRTVAEAALMACSPDYVLLRPAAAGTQTPVSHPITDTHAVGRHAPSRLTTCGCRWGVSRMRKAASPAAPLR